MLFRIEMLTMILGEFDPACSRNISLPYHGHGILCHVTEPWPMSNFHTFHVLRRHDHTAKQRCDNQ